jgi:hypothetical protein
MWKLNQKQSKSSLRSKTCKERQSMSLGLFNDSCTRTRPCNYRWDCACVNEFPMLAEGVDVVMLRTSAINGNISVWGPRTVVEWRHLQFGGKSRWVKAYAFERGGGGASCVPSFNYILVFPLQLRKNTGNPSVPAKCKVQFVLAMWPPGYGRPGLAFWFPAAFG